MATLSNQTTNLSTLSTALTELCQRFEASGHLETGNHGRERHNDKKQREDEAKEFLDSLEKRVDTVDCALCKSTEHLLPTMRGRGQPSRMTTTEMTQVLHSLHEIHSRQIQRFASILGDTSLSAATVTSEQPSSSQTPTGKEKSGDTPYHWLLMQPLEKVIETDNETDRASIASMRSLSFSHTPGGKGPATPLTPSINGLRLSASTASILTQEILDFDSPLAQNATHSNGDGEYASSPATSERATGVSNLSLEALKKYHSESFEQEDQNNDTKEASHNSQDRSGSLFRHLQDDDDECDTSTNSTTVVVQDRAHSTPETSGRKSINSKNTREEPTIHSMKGDEDEDDNDEVTTLCPTLIANRSLESNNTNRVEQKQPTKHILSPQTDVFGRAAIFRNQQCDLTGSHVVVQAETSPSHTMLTMDNTMFLHDTDAISLSSRITHDAASLGEETPVLDRYRIIQDDNSVGFKVLPNKRGSQRKLRNGNSQAAAEEEGKTGDNGIPRSVKFLERSGVRDDCPSNWFRKTPNPSRSGELPAGALEESLQELDSTLNKENSGENTGLLPKVHSTAHDKKNRKVFRRTPFKKENTCVAEGDIKKSVGFQSPLNQTSVDRQSFRKTPHPASFPTDNEENEGKERNTLRFETSDLEFGDSVTPFKDEKQMYRKTPHPRVTEKLSIESLKFAPGTQFQCSTPARGEPKTSRKTPFVKDSNDEAKTPFAKDSGDDNQQAEEPVTPMNYFAQRSKEFATLTPLRAGEAFRKSPYRRLLRTTSPPRRARRPEDQRGPLKGQLFETSLARAASDRGLTSPVSLASTISALTGATGLTYAENQRELFPPVDSHQANNSNNYNSLMDDREPTKMAALTPERKSVSSLIPKISEGEFEAGELKQFSLEETNSAITALNGATFLRRESGDSNLQFLDAEAYKILRNVGFKRRRCKGILMALCHWGRLTMREESDSVMGMSSHYFEVVPGGALNRTEIIPAD